MENLFSEFFMHNGQDIGDVLAELSILMRQIFILFLE
jgi:hypothetical protein